jgi:hypothetical protein
MLQGGHGGESYCVSDIVTDRSPPDERSGLLSQQLDRCCAAIDSPEDQDGESYCGFGRACDSLVTNTAWAQPKHPAGNCQRA